MKKCSKCREVKDETDFAKPTMCKICYNAYARNYYKTVNKEKHKQYVNNWNEKNKEWLQKYKKEKRKLPETKEKVKEYYTNNKKFIDSYKMPCIICGESEKCAIDFHHLNPKTKNFCLSRKNFSKKLILQEINKCVCLCGNCHRLLNAGWIKLDETM